MNRRLTLLLFFATILAISGCTKTLKLNSTFDEAKAKATLTGGQNKVAGSALLRRVNGEVVTCAGNSVSIFPVNNTSKEWINIVYTNGEPNGIDYEEGYRQFSGATKLNILGDEKFLSLEKTTKCDPQGKFTFGGLQDGDFYIQTTVTWTVFGSYGESLIQGGALFKKVRLKGGEPTEVVLSN